MKEQRLSAVLAQRDGIKTRTNKEFTNIKGLLGRSEFFQGLNKSYEKKDETGEDYPSQMVNVRSRVSDILDTLRSLVTEQFDIEATIDKGNQKACADIVVGNDKILENIPVTTLLTLERDLKQVREFIVQLPTLDPAFEWNMDKAAGLFKTGEVRTNRTAKIQKPIVLYDATDKHPAQTQLITEDQVVGQWVTTNSSGAIPADEKKRFLKRCDLLLDAVKSAREDANAVKVENVQVGKAVFDFILGSSD